jgi:hypothetical protein
LHEARGFGDPSADDGERLLGVSVRDPGWRLQPGQEFAGLPVDVRVGFGKRAFYEFAGKVAGDEDFCPRVVLLSASTSHRPSHSPGLAR